MTKQTRAGVDAQDGFIGFATMNYDSQKKDFDSLMAFGTRFDNGRFIDGATGKEQSKCSIRSEKRRVRVSKANKQKLLRRINLFFFEEYGFFTYRKAMDSSRSIITREVAQYYGIPVQQVPYFLRSFALDNALSLQELFFVTKHIANRRGVNLAEVEDDSETKQMAAMAESVLKTMKATKSRTYGEYVNKSIDFEDKFIGTEAIARNREMIKQEYDLILQAQVKFGVISEKNAYLLKKMVFFQKPLKSIQGMIGFCEFEKGERCSSKYSLVAEEFIALQNINDTLIKDENGERALTSDEREVLMDALSCGRISFSDARKALGLQSDSRFNHEYQYHIRKGFSGLNTRGKMVEIFGATEWKELERQKRVNNIVNNIVAGSKSDLVKVGLRFGLSRDKAQEYASVDFTVGRMSLSTKAMRKLNAEMRFGVPYATAVKKTYGPSKAEKLDYVPHFTEVFENRLTNNPYCEIYMSHFSDYFRIVNEMVGGIDKVNMEMGRDLANSIKDKKKMSWDILKNKKKKDNAIKFIIDLQAKHPNNPDILVRTMHVVRVGLAIKTDWIDPYTMKPINPVDMFSGKYTIEHIIPKGYYHTDIDINLLICDKFENQVKDKRLPSEYLTDDELNVRCEFLKKCKLLKEADIFSTKKKDLDKVIEKYGRKGKLNSMGFISSKQREYLLSMYEEKDILIINGKITKIVREFYELDKDGYKNREDLRHHVIDAITMLFMSPSMIRDFSKLHKSKYGFYDKKMVRALMEKHDSIPDHHDKLRKQVFKIYDTIVINHRRRNRLGGALHGDNPYSHSEDGKRNKRISLDNVAKVKANLHKVKDEDIRNELSEELKTGYVGGPIRLKSGMMLKKIKIEDDTKSIKVEQDGKIVYYDTTRNHHVEIFRKGKEGVFRTISYYEANRRHRLGQPIINKEMDCCEFVTDIACGDMLFVDNEYWVVKFTGDSQIEVLKHTEARGRGAVKKERAKSRAEDKALSETKSWTIKSIGTRAFAKGEVKKAFLPKIHMATS